MTDILLVDDNRTNLVQIGGYLDRLNLSYVTAMNGAEAIKVIENNHPSIILLDIVMPIMDGFETLKSIRRRQDLADTYVIMLTSMQKRNDILKAIQLGADDYITKPVGFDTLSQKVNQVFALHGMR